MNEPRCPWLKLLERICFPTDSIFFRRLTIWHICSLHVIYPWMSRSGYLWFGLDSARASDHKRPDPEMPLRIPNYCFLQFPSNLPQHFYERWKVTGARALPYIMQITSRILAGVNVQFQCVSWRRSDRSVVFTPKSDTLAFYSGWKCFKVNHACFLHSPFCSISDAVSEINNIQYCLHACIHRGVDAAYCSVAIRKMRWHTATYATLIYFD